MCPSVQHTYLEARARYFDAKFAGGVGMSLPWKRCGYFKKALENSSDERRSAKLAPLRQRYLNVYGTAEAVPLKQGEAQ
jgi:hypothetical protein